MPDTLIHSLAPSQSPDASVHRPRLLGRVLAGLAIAILAVSFLDEAAAFLIRHTRLRRSITAHLSAAFGRPVEVGDYSFTIWSGPEVVAESVSVAEDPRFGYEYFLRAESLSVRLSVLGLLRGHFVLGRVLLTQPSLNLVRDAAGDWNFEEWLPRPANGGTANERAAPQPRGLPGFVLNRIEVDGGRINFKIEEEKLPFALVDVDGYVEPAGPGHWRLDLTASPLRAPVILQQPGTLRVAGEVGGTSSRLRPAKLRIFWSDASVSDLLRLARNSDPGIRGLMNLEIDTQAREDKWTLAAQANFSGLHSWNLPAQSDNPSLALTAKAELDPARSNIEITEGAIEAPHSRVNFTTALDWSAVDGVETPRPVSSRTAVGSSAIALDDLLAWVRAFCPDVASDISLQGTALLRLESHGWPPRLDQASFAWDRAVLAGPRLRVPIRLSAGSLQAKEGRWSLSPVNLSFGGSDGSLRLDASSRTILHGIAPLAISGEVAHTRDLISAAGSFGWNLSHGWDLEGPLRCALRWPAGALPWREQPQGTADWGTAAEEASLQTPFLNQPVRAIRAHAEWKPGLHTISISSADAFGARWSGSFQRRDASPEWQFDLSADHLAAADLDRWLDPRWKQSFLSRLLPFLDLRSPAVVTPEDLGAGGTISVAQFTLSSMVLHKVESDLSIRGRTIELTAARAQMYGGSVTGKFLADLHGVPRYSADVKFASVDLADLAPPAAAQPSAGNQAVSFSGLASGDMSIRAEGTDRASLVASLSCHGSWKIRDPEIRGINLADSLADGTAKPGASAFRSSSAQFSCANGRVRIASLSLGSVNQEFDVSGSVDFARHADLRVQVVPPSEGPRVLSGNGGRGAAAAKIFSLTGTLSSLQVHSAPPASPPK